MVSTESTTNTGTPQPTTEISTSTEYKLKEVNFKVGFVHSNEKSLDEEQREQNQLNIKKINNICITESCLMMLPETHPEFSNFLRLQLENIELTQWKTLLQAKINNERADIVRLKDFLHQLHLNRDLLKRNVSCCMTSNDFENVDYTRIIEHYLKENSLLEQKRNLLACEIFKENKELIQLQIDLAMKQFES